LRQNIIGREGAIMKISLGKEGLPRGVLTRISIYSGEYLVHNGPQARRVAKPSGDLFPLLADRRQPTCRSMSGLRLPLEEMGDKNPEAALQFAPVAPAHTLNLLGKIVGAEL
jgi:hypothetical protein